MKIAIGCDHTVVDLKNQLIENLKSNGHVIIDSGCYTKNRTHYPIYGRAVGIHVAKKEVDLGITICGTGVGISTSANKVKGVRAALVTDVISAIRAKQRYNANIIACGGRVLGIGSIINIVNEFINAKYQGNNDDLINILDEKIPHLIDNKHLFEKIISKWEEGDYTNHLKQGKIELPKE